MRFKHAIFAILTWLAVITSALAEFYPAVGVVRRGNAQGTGTIIAHSIDGKHSLVLTAAHVIETSGQTSFTVGGVTRIGGYLNGSHSADLATFVIDAVNVTPMPIWPTKMIVGTSCWAEGFAAIGAGRLRGRIEREKQDGITDFSIPSRPGDSGSAIYVVDTDGRPYVVGVITGYYGDDNQLSLGAGATLIRRYLDSSHYGPHEAKVTNTGHVLFGGNGPIRRLLQGRSHPQPWSLGIGADIGIRGGGICPPAGCPPSQGVPGFEQEYAPPAFVQPPYQPPAQQQPTPAGPDINELLRQQQELLDQQRRRQKPIYSLPGELRADFDASGLKEDLLEDMANDPRFRGKDGRDGKDGKDGRPGVDGVSGMNGRDAEVSDEHLSAIANSLYAQMQQDPSFRGPPGESANVDVDVLTQKIMASLPSIQVDLVDPDGGRTSVKQDLSKGDATFEFRFKNRMNIATPQQRTR